MELVCKHLFKDSLIYSQALLAPLAPLTSVPTDDPWTAMTLAGMLSLESKPSDAGHGGCDLNREH